MKKRTALFFAVSIILLAAAVLLSLIIGTRDIPLKDIGDTLRGAETASLYAPILERRMIRTVLGLLAGCALGTAGCLMQTITGNPVADPSILGVNTGASLFVVTGIAFFGVHTAGQYMALALAGAAFTAALVFGIASLSSGNTGVSPVRLALSGAAVSTACSSLISTVMLPRTNVMQVFRFWQTGSISGGSWESIRMITPLLLAGLITAFLLIPSLNILMLGDDIATGLGVNVPRTRLLGAVSGVLLCGAVTAAAGPIGFVGLMIPHLVRQCTGNDLKTLLPLSALDGAVLLLAADVAGRIVSRPSELEVGIVTAFIGAPVFIAVVRKAKVGK
ncbi:MAG TPA: iron ABC transporter [Erysipelotrichaceae bacterium]|nr:iron ABC transporter [Erysipelotrichaceae bacterium]HCK89429.1 iron ABC transporter [Erysipelotrichaceae bacterium]